MDTDGKLLPYIMGHENAGWVEEVGSSVEVLSTVKTAQGSHAVAVRQGRLLATSFHPELTGDLRVHRYFFDQVCTGAIK
jgi:5'-phosphate synthase pdxT subunit